MPPKTKEYYQKQREKERKKKQAEFAVIKSEHDAHGDPAKAKELELSIVLPALERAGRRMVDVPGDGDCLFTSLLHQLRLSEHAAAATIASSSAMRGAIAQHIVSHAAEYAPFIADTTVDEYCAALAKKATHWGTMLEARAAAELFGATIRIVAKHGTETVGDGASDWCVVFLESFFTLGAHYNPTVPVAGDDADA
jgi:OTU domain-containing protein 6